MGNSKLGKLLKGNNEVFYSLSFIVLIEIDQFIIKISKLNLDLKWYMYSVIFFSPNISAHFGLASRESFKRTIKRNLFHTL